MQIQICISLLSLKFKYSNPCKRGGGGHTQWQWPKHQLSEWVTRVNSWEGLCSFCPVHDVTSAWPFSSHYQIWLMLCFGRLMFKWGHFLLKAFYYVCFYMRTANNPRVCYAAFTVVPLSLWLYCLWWGVYEFIKAHDASSCFYKSDNKTQTHTLRSCFPWQPCSPHSLTIPAHSFDLVKPSKPHCLRTVTCHSNLYQGIHFHPC